MSDRIRGGYILLARRLLESDLMEKPPLYLKLWTWLLLKASHQIESGRGNLERGQLLTTLSDIREAGAYRMGNRREYPTFKQIRVALKYFRDNDMLDWRKTTRGMVITILNYDYYQDPGNYRQNSGDVPADSRRARGGHAAVNPAVTDEPSNDGEKEGPGARRRARGGHAAVTTGAHYRQQGTTMEQGEEYIPCSSGVNSSGNGDGLPAQKKPDISETHPELYETSRQFHIHQQTQHPTKIKTLPEKKIRDGANVLRLLTERDGYDLQREILPALKWAVRDEFWSYQLLSLSGLRKQGKNGEMKIVNIIASMERQQANPPKEKEEESKFEKLRAWKQRRAQEV